MWKYEADWSHVKSNRKGLTATSHNVRGLCIATEQYSSFGGCTIGLTLGGFDHTEVEIQDREQVEVREKVEARETEEEDKTRKQQTLKHLMTCA